MAIQEQRYTDDDLLRLSAEGKRFELVKGELLPMSPTGDEHGVVAMWFGHLVMAHVAENDLGEVTAAETGFILIAEPRTIRAPDIGFIDKERLPKMTGGFYPVAPDLAVEVVSPGDTAKEIRAKVTDYLEAGTKLVVVIFPELRTVDVHKPDQTSISLKGNDVLDCGDVLPGFRLPVKEIFKRLRDK